MGAAELFLLVVGRVWFLQDDHVVALQKRKLDGGAVRFFAFVHICLKDIDCHASAVLSVLVVHLLDRVIIRRFGGDWSRRRASCGRVLGGEWRADVRARISSPIGGSLEGFVVPEGMICWAVCELIYLLFKGMELGFA